LLLIRTPLQAWLARQVLQAEVIADYDLVYFTHDDSSEDRHYFGELAARANESQYCHVPVWRYDILSHLYALYQTHSWRHRQSPDVVVLASINSLVINALAAVHASSELVTFDDGLANILPRGTYHCDKSSIRMRLYRSLLGATDLDAIKNRISRHYTIYPDFDNIVEVSHLRYLVGWRRDENQTSAPRNVRTYFISQPYEETLTFDQVRALEAHLRTIEINCYVRHPRERRVLDIGVPNLDKHGLIAEDAILRHAQGQPFHLIGWFSTALFNLSAVAQSSTMLLLHSDPNSHEMASLACRAGCKIVLI
jgi:beta-galactosamide-alpha-2,3-sialyltransferase